MAKVISLVLLLFALVVCSAPETYAQTTEFTFQGSLKDGANPANGNHDFEFALFSAVSGGTQLGSTITLTNVPVQNGVFSVPLNFGSNFPGASRFLEIRVRPSGGGAFTPLSPRQAVSSSPYSIKSLNADNAAQLGGLPASQYIVSGAAAINAGTQFNIGGQRVLSTSGANNVFAGVGAGQNNTGGGNAFFGDNAGSANTSGGVNSFFGVNAGSANTIGDSNAFFGRDAGSSNTDGDFNSFFGARAGDSNTTGINNSFFGGDAGRFTTGSENSFFGRSAGASTTGANNVFVGASTGVTNVSGSNNTLLGFQANVGLTNLTNATAIGSGAQVNTSNSLVLGTGSTDVGIGTSSPTHRLTVGAPEAPVVASAVVGVYNAGPAFSIVRNTTNNVEALMGAETANVIFGSMTDHDILIRTNNVNRITISDNFVNFSQISVNFAGTVSLGSLGSSEGNVQLCLSNPSRVVAQCSSSLRYKKNILGFTPGLDLVRRLRPVSFHWKGSGLPDLGLVAEEVADVEPLLVTHNDKGEIEGVKYDRIGVVMINVVKEQQAQIEAQQKKIEAQDDAIDRLWTEIEALKMLVCAQNPRSAVCKPGN